MNYFHQEWWDQTYFKFSKRSFPSTIFIVSNCSTFYWKLIDFPFGKIIWENLEKKINVRRHRISSNLVMHVKRNYILRNSSTNDMKKRFIHIQSLFSGTHYLQRKSSLNQTFRGKFSLIALSKLSFKKYGTTQMNVSGSYY